MRLAGVPEAELQSQGDKAGLGQGVWVLPEDPLLLSEDLGQVPYPLHASISSAVQWGHSTALRMVPHRALGPH